jgi:hypothetical protein
MLAQQQLGPSGPPRHTKPHEAEGTIRRFPRFGNCRVTPWINLLAIAAAGCAGQTTKPAVTTATFQPLPGGVTQYTDKDGRFSVTYGPDWRLVNPPAVGQVLSIRTGDFTPTTAPVSRPSADFGTLGIAVQADPESKSDAQTLHEVSAGIADFVFNHGGSKVTIRPDSIDGIEARQVRFVTGGKAAVCYVVVRRRTAVILDAAAPTARFEQFLPTVRAVAETLTVSER